MGKHRAIGTRRSTSPTADELLRREAIDRAMRDLTVPHRRQAAYWRLREFGPAAREAVEAGLLADDPTLRAQCALLIDRLAGNDSFELMLLLLDDPDPRVRHHAIHALACDRCKGDDVCALPSGQVIAEAVRMLETDPDAHVRAIALEVLARWVHEDDGDGGVRDAWGRAQRTRGRCPSLSRPSGPRPWGRSSTPPSRRGCSDGCR